MRVISADGTIDIPYEQSTLVVRRYRTEGIYSNTWSEIVVSVGINDEEDEKVWYNIAAYCRDFYMTMGGYMSEEEAKMEMERLRAAYTCGRQIYRINSDIHEI